jgi:hypothetical protein
LAAKAEQQQLTDILLDELEATGFPSAVQLDRIERLISTREELESYLEILTRIVRRTQYPGSHILDRLERLLKVAQRFDQETQNER